MLEEYSQGVDEKLRGLELESIQDYIAESDNLVDLHKQVRRGGAAWWGAAISQLALLDWLQGCFRFVYKLAGWGPHCFLGPGLGEVGVWWQACSSSIVIAHTRTLLLLRDPP